MAPFQLKACDGKGAITEHMSALADRSANSTNVYTSMGKHPPLVEHIASVLNCTSIEDVWSLHTAKMKEYGFDRLLYISTQFRAHGTYGELADALVLTNHDRRFIEVFLGQELYLHVPTNDWFLRNTGACSWTHIFKKFNKGNHLTESERQVKNLYAKWNLVAGYTISFARISDRGVGAIGLCAPKGQTQDDVDALWEQKGDEIFLLNNLVHQKVSSLPHTGQHRPLTRRQREALEWVADGKTAQDVAIIMDLSPVTVEKHLKLAREALGADTTAQAVQKASRLNQLFLGEERGAALR